VCEACTEKKQSTVAKKHTLLITVDAGSPDEAETVEESIRHAKQAVTLDIKDGQSWCNLLI
jgi:hypothetical protein